MLSNTPPDPMRLHHFACTRGIQSNENSHAKQTSTLSRRGGGAGDTCGATGSTSRGELGTPGHATRLAESVATVLRSRPLQTQLARLDDPATRPRSTRLMRDVQRSTDENHPRGSCATGTPVNRTLKHDSPPLSTWFLSGCATPDETVAPVHLR